MSRSCASTFSLVLKIRNEPRDVSQGLPAVQQHATPGEITISLASVCRAPSCIQKHNSPLRFVFQLHCTSICIQRGHLGVSVPAVPSADEVFITQDSAFLIRHSDPFSHLSAARASCRWGGGFTRECGGRPDRQRDINRR